VCWINKRTRRCQRVLHPSSANHTAIITGGLRVASGTGCAPSVTVGLLTGPVVYASLQPRVTAGGSDFTSRPSPAEMYPKYNL